MRVLFLTGRELTYARNEVLLRALQRFSTVDIAARPVAGRSLLLNSLRVTAAALPRLLRQNYDLVFIGFYGYVILRTLGKFIREPILFDAFISNYDTLCYDRQVFAPNSLPGKGAFWLDQATCALASHVLLDTQSHVAYFQNTFGLPPERLSALPVGCSDEIYQPRPVASHPTTRVLYYSTFLPLHGVETVIQAAALLKDEPITFDLIGAGSLLAEMQTTIQQLQLTNVTLSSPVPARVLAERIADADICLGGHFGQSEKAGRVIPGKIYQMLAVGRAVIAAGAPGNYELLRQRETALFVPPGDPAALANAIRTLHLDPQLRGRLADQGRSLYEAQCSEAVITERLQTLVNKLTAAF